MDADKVPYVDSDESFERSYRRVAEWRARTLRDAAEIHGGSRRQERVRFAVVEPLLRSLTPYTGARALDLGCGVGTYTPVLRDVGFEVIGVDFSVPSLARARRAPGVHYAAAEAYRLPFPEKTFDFVLCIGLIYVVTDPARVLAEIVRTTRPGARVMLQALHPGSLKFRASRQLHRLRRQDFDIRAYYPEEVRTLLTRAGLAPLGMHPLSRLGWRPLTHEYLYLAQRGR
jgi:SAM-dependent methyltransferase